MNTHTVSSLQSEKWDNFKARFAEEIACVAPAVAGSEWEADVLPQITSALILAKNMGLKLAPMVEKRDHDLLIGYIDLQDAEQGRAARSVYNDCDDEKRDLLWKYLKFFLESTIELLKSN